MIIYITRDLRVNDKKEDAILKIDIAPLSSSEWLIEEEEMEELISKLNDYEAKLLVYFESDYFNELFLKLLNYANFELMKPIFFKTDYLWAPASSKFHGNWCGGLLNHSLKVLEVLEKVTDLDEELVLAALAHDLCKVNRYEPAITKTGKWSNAMTGRYRHQKGSYGHGDLSIFTLARLIGFDDISDKVAEIIRWHMMEYDREFRMYESKLKYRSLVQLFSGADKIATALEELEAKNNGTR